MSAGFTNNRPLPREWPVTHFQRPDTLSRGWLCSSQVNGHRHTDEGRAAVGYVFHKVRGCALDSPEGMTVPEAEVLGTADSNADFEQQQGCAHAHNRDAEICQKTSQSEFRRLVLREIKDTSALVRPSKTRARCILLYRCCNVMPSTFSRKNCAQQTIDGTVLC